MFDVTIRHEPAVELAAVFHRGPYPEVGRAFRVLMARLAQAGLAAVGPAVAITYDDPDVVPAAGLRAHAGVAVQGAARWPPGLDRVVVPGGRTAVILHRGPYEDLDGPWRAIYRWLDASGEAAADAPPYERYLNGPDDVAPADLLTEVCVPLRG